LRVSYAWEGRAPVYDAVAYAHIAANLDEGRGFTLGREATQPASNYSPGLPLFVSGLYKLSGGVHERFARLVLALIGSLAVLFTYLIGRRLSGPLAGLIGAAAVAIYPALLEYQGMLMSEPLAATLLSGAVLSMLWAADPGRSHPARGSCRGAWGALRAGHGPSSTPHAPRHPRERWLIPGLLLGALALTRPEYLGVAVLVGLAVFARDLNAKAPEIGAGWRQSLVQAAVMLVGVVLVVGPWTIRNAVVLDRFVPVSTGGGQVLFAGAYMPSGGDPERVGEEVLERHPGLTRRLVSEYLPAGATGADIPLDAAPDRGTAAETEDAEAARRAAVLERVRLEQILAALAAQRYPGMEADKALSRMGRDLLWDDVSEEPLEYLGFLARKVSRSWSHGPRDVMHEPAWEALHLALIALGLLGLAVLAWQRRWEALLLATVLLSITAVSALLVASPRRVLVMLPLVAALAGVGLGSLWTRMSKGQRPTQTDAPSPQSLSRGCTSP
jgi:4-amino-4-deoxy-L-arabinose transferase-like glycosyltransferase